MASKQADQRGVLLQAFKSLRMECAVVPEER
jgi:hypothetical protein